MRSPLAVLKSARSRPRTVGYYLVMLVPVTVFTLLWLFEGRFLFTVWFGDGHGITRTNDVAAGAYYTVMLACALAAMIRPMRTPGASKVLIVGAVLFAVLVPLSFVLSDPLVTGVLFVVAFFVVGLIVWLHPARSALDPTRQFDLQYPLLGLTLLVAVPFLWLAGDHQWAQFTLDNELAADWYYGGLAMHLVYIVVLSGLASVDGAHRRTLLAGSIFLAAPFALASVIYPDDPLSLGVVGGVLVLSWCLAVALAGLRSSERL